MCLQLLLGADPQLLLVPVQQKNLLRLGMQQSPIPTLQQSNDSEFLLLPAAVPQPYHVMLGLQQSSVTLSRLPASLV